MTTEEQKAILWEMDTVTVRRVLRKLNNMTRTINPSILASIRHENANRHIFEHYLPEAIEQAIDFVRREIADEQNRAPTPELPTDTTISRMREPNRFPPARHDTLPAMAPPEPSDTIAPDWESMTGGDEDKAKLLMQLLSTGITEKKLRKILEDYVTNRFLSNSLTDLASSLGQITNDLTKKVAEVQDLVLSSNATILTIQTPQNNQIELGTVHKDTPKLIQFLSCGISCFLTGPSGSGKSIGAEKAALALELPFYSISVCSQTTKTEILGYMDANGIYRRTQFRDAYENGGVFLFDEIDAGNANVLAVLNNALSGSRCPFPDGMILRHDKFRCVAAGNTWGTGKTMQYVGRNALDAATMNRFAVIYWDYDEALETKIAELPIWSRYVQQCRAEIKRRGVQVLVTPRASIYGAKLIKAGIPVQTVIDTVLFPNLDPQLRSALPPAPVLEGSNDLL